MKPYYESGRITIYHADCREVLPLEADVMVTDPPFGIEYESGQFGTLPRSIKGDSDTSLREFALCLWRPRPALVFGSWRVARPAETRQVLIWDSLGALGMGALDIPWKPAHQEIYVIGKGFNGPRTTDVLSYPPVQGLASNGRVHPHEKPIGLLMALLSKCPAGCVLDPFCGSGPTLVAAKKQNRRAIGIEIEEKYCEIAARRLSQKVFAFEESPRP